MEELNLVYYKLYIKQLLQAKIEEVNLNDIDNNEDINNYSPSDPIFRYESLRFKNVWVQGNVQLFDDEDDSTELENNKNNNSNISNNDKESSLTKSTSSNYGSDITRFMISDGTSDILAVKSPSILSIDISDGQYILVAGTLIYDIDTDTRFIIVQKMANLSLTTTPAWPIVKIKDQWKLELRHIQTKKYNLSESLLEDLLNQSNNSFNNSFSNSFNSNNSKLNNSNNNSINNNNISNNSVNNTNNSNNHHSVVSIDSTDSSYLTAEQKTLASEDGEEFVFPVDDDEVEDNDVSRIECQDESRYSFYNDEYEEIKEEDISQHQYQPSESFNNEDSLTEDANHKTNSIIKDEEELDSLVFDDSNSVGNNSTSAGVDDKDLEMFDLNNTTNTTTNNDIDISSNINNNTTTDNSINTATDDSSIMEISNNQGANDIILDDDDGW